MKARRRRRPPRIGDWPFGAAGVDCRACLREPCRCARDELRFFPLIVGELPPVFSLLPDDMLRALIFGRGERPD